MDSAGLLEQKAEGEVAVLRVEDAQRTVVTESSVVDNVGVSGDEATRQWQWTLSVELGHGEVEG